ncbi:histidine-rich glycoprotein [Tetranychus urticae]|uniref:histidine-rich glycoprotein n=1 Tax=Tetranychus urticae TaxID=32264 RepID=UPI00077C03FB|nr:histidine-rich glycoprotein [Tetranychus urticae]
MMKTIFTVVNAVILWSLIEAVALKDEKLSPKLVSKEENASASRWLLQKSNETKSSASFDSFRVSTPETNRDGTLLLDSYHDFTSKHHHHLHHPHNGHHYGAREDAYHHHGHHNYHHYDHHDYPYFNHNRHHRHLPYPSDDVGSEEVANPDGVTDGIDSVNNDGEITEPIVDSEIPADPAVNGELVDPESEEQPEPLDDADVTEDPIESDVEEIPIEDVPGEPVNGEIVSNESGYPRTAHNYDYNHYDPSLSNTYDHRYPIFSHLPPKHFKCSHVKHSGHSSDIEARCQVILPGNRSGKWEILHFLHKSSPLKSNAVIYLDHGDHHRRYHNHHYPHNYYHPHYSHSLYPHHPHHYHHSHHHRHHYNGHHYPETNYIRRKK